MWTKARVKNFQPFVGHNQIISKSSFEKKMIRVEMTYRTSGTGKTYYFILAIGRLQWFELETSSMRGRRAERATVVLVSCSALPEGKLRG